MTLGQKLKKLRDEKDFTQAELVTDLNTIYGTRINPAMWSKWENDKDVPSLDNLRIISDYFRVSMDYLSGLTEDLEEPYYPDMTLEEHMLSIYQSEDYYKSKYKSIRSLGDDGVTKELARILQMAKENPEIRVLFSLAENLKPEDLKQLISFIKMLQKDGD